MADQKNEKRLDELLDALLALYCDAQPRLGFQTRLLANLHASIQLKPKASTVAKQWLCIGAAAATMTTAITAVYLKRLAHLPELPRTQVTGVPVLPGNEAVRQPATRSHPRKIAPQKVSVASAEQVGQQVFPTPTPLSDQERLLLRYLAGTPREEVIIQSRSDEPPEGPQPLGPQVQQFPGREILNTR